MNRIIIKSLVFTLSLLTATGVMAQQKLIKVSQAIKVNSDVNINLNTSHCNIVFDTWKKDVVEIEAYIEGEQLSEEELDDALKSWKIDIDATTDKVTIGTQGRGTNVWVYRTDTHGDGEAVEAVIKELKYELAEIPEIDFDVHVEVPEVPEIPEIPELPPLPPLPEGVGAVTFDYNAYKKEGEKYLEAYSKKFEEAYGEAFAKKMQAWSETFEERWNEEEFNKKMEEWGERYAENMEAHQERIIAHEARNQVHKERAEAIKTQVKRRQEELKHHQKERVILLKEREKRIEELVHGKAHGKVKKTIKIKMPKGTKLKVDVKHGEIEFAANIDNLRADLAYTKFKAQSIDGSLTSINASYSPVYVSTWHVGQLNLKYVKKAQIDYANHLVLNATSSNVDVNHLLKSAVIDGTIGDLKILNIDDKFSSLNMILQNSDVVINLPDVDCNVQYNGTKSRFSHPKKSPNEQVSNFSTGNLASGKSIVVNAKYSTVTMQ
ncbi:hypothetical protein KFZ70_11725 [Tamlana fucoidanivorans]|uniref:DUF4097 domain-containing protein n=1 Tax=Allotamlana fucoidanivorans TaxID=2583814 RepID=A0A5C4SI74_9FLAO|nr:hypothetical protein [Tamlana fucoidanivorans]TNJ43062.1 hypothetical protein FGF67_11915 [Tamlana fucoidanivorans]